jgi:hypothetical protein
MIKIVVSVKAVPICDAHVNSNNNFVFFFHCVLVGKWNSASVADPGCLSRIPDPDFYPSRIPDPIIATKERG